MIFLLWSFRENFETHDGQHEAPHKQHGDHDIRNVGTRK